LASRPTNDLTAYDLYLRAYAKYLSSSWQIPDALWLMEQAIQRDPRYRPALAFCVPLSSAASCRSENREECADFARRALEVAEDDPVVLANATNALGYRGEAIGAMLTLVDRALALNPNFARGWQVSGVLRLEAGQPDIALEHLETALRLGPRARAGNTHNLIGNAHFYARRFNDALPRLLLAIQEDPTFLHPYRVLAACYAHMGRLDEGQQTVARLRVITPS
jgi:tetratricopeptide (TPR) repeat protein